MKLFFTSVLGLFLTMNCQAQLVINEVLYDPSNTSLEGDANGDGTYDQTQDEFIEFVNMGISDLDISKYKICDRVLATGLKTIRHTVAMGTVIPPNGAFVVFGGGSAVGTFGGAIIRVDVGTQGLSLGNTGESVLVEDSLGTIIDSINTDALSNDPNESYTRNPDVTGIFQQHHFATAGVLFSPGTKVDGTPYAVTAIQSSQEKAAFTVYPNPGSGVFSVSLDRDNGSGFQMFDALGKPVSFHWSNERELNMGNQPVGIYYLKVGIGASIQTTRIQIIR